MLDDVYKQLTALQKQMDNLVKPEVPLGLSFISETVLSGTAASVTFSSIPQIYRHLRLIIQARTSVAAETDLVLLRFNGDSGANYDVQVLAINAATLTGVAARGNTSIGLGRAEGANSRADNFSPTQGWVYGYALTNREKWANGLSASFGDVSADADLREEYRTGRWRNTAVITSLTLLPNTGPNFVSGSIFQLYGLR